MFNSEQRDYMASLERIAPERRCYCGWYVIDQCPHCPAGLTLATKIDLRCSVCEGHPPAHDLSAPIRHRIGCRTLAAK